MIEDLNAISTGIQNAGDCRAEFLPSIRRYRLFSVFIFCVSISAMLSILVSLIPFRDQFKIFFDRQFGNQFGDMLRGISYPLIASPPVIAGIVWMMRRFKQPEYCCTQCAASFAIAHRAEAVVRNNECPLCGTIVFPEVGGDTPVADIAG